MTLQPLKQKMAIHVLPDISRSKGNQTIRFGQLIKYKTRNNFLEKWYPKCSGETTLFPESFLKNPN